MKIVPIFADEQIPKGLFAICLNPNEIPTPNEYDKFIKWVYDNQNLRSFFKEREHLLKKNPYFPNTIKDAVKRTFAEMRLLEQHLKPSKYNSLADLCNFLNDNFKALDNQSNYGGELQPSKTRGPNNNCWIRIYAIRVNSEMFIVTGGAIKLVLEMNEDDIVDHERRKLLRVRDYLKQEGMYDAETYKEIILNL